MNTLKPLFEEFSQEKWTYPNVYYIRELKDIFNLIQLIPFKSLSDLTKAVKEKIPCEGKSWTDRRVYECTNALTKFKLITKGYEPIIPIYEISEFGEKLSQTETEIFLTIYFTFIRFRQFTYVFAYNSESHSFESIQQLSSYDLLQTCRLNSSSVLAFSTSSKYSNHFRQLLDNEVFYIDSQSTHIMRFWDVFTKWGKELGLLNSFSIKDLPHGQIKERIVESLNIDWHQVSCSYFYSNITEIDIKMTITNLSLGRHVYLPDLILGLILYSRIALTYAIEIVSSFIMSNPNNVSYERTSEIFIKDNEKKFFPIINGSFISHLYLKK